MIDLLQPTLKDTEHSELYNEVQIKSKMESYSEYDFINRFLLKKLSLDHNRFYIQHFGLNSLHFNDIQNSKVSVEFTGTFSPKDTYFDFAIFLLIEDGNDTERCFFDLYDQYKHDFFNYLNQFQIIKNKPTIDSNFDFFVSSKSLKLHQDNDSYYETNKYLFRRNVDLIKKPFHLNATYKSYYKFNEKEEMEHTFFDYLYFSCFVAYHLNIPDFHYDDFLFVNKLHDSTDFGFRIISQFEKHSKPDFLDLYFFDENGRLTDESKELLSINFKI